MTKKFDVTALGEVLIDFTESGRSSSGMRLFEQNAGGAVANTVCQIAKLGKKASFIGKTGHDMHGIFLAKTLESVGVDTSGLIMADDVFTTLAFVSLSDNGERSFSFARKPGADTMLKIAEVNIDILHNTKILHVGSLSMTDEPARSATLYAINEAKKSGATISYDPNYRASLWTSREHAIEQMRSILPLVDIIKISDEETELITDIHNPEGAATKLIGMGISCVIVTLGKEGALVCTKEGMNRVPTFEGKVVDTTGAGDSFWGAFLYCLVDSTLRPNEISLSIAADFARFANASATICISRRGAIPALPTLEEVQKISGFPLHHTID